MTNVPGDKPVTFAEHEPVTPPDNATVATDAFTLSFSGEASGGELYQAVLHAIRTTYIVRLNGQDVEWGCLRPTRNLGPDVLHYRDWDEDAGVPVGPTRTISLEKIEEIYVY